MGKKTTLAAPPAAPLVRLLEVVELVLVSRQQVLGGMPAAAFLEGLALRLDDALLHGLILAAQMIDLLLQVAPLGQSMHQGGLDRRGLAPELRGRGVGGGDLVAQGVVGAAGRVQFARQRLDDALQRSDGCGDGFGGRQRTLARFLVRLAALFRLRRADNQGFGRDTDLDLERVIADPLRP